MAEHEPKPFVKGQLTPRSGCRQSQLKSTENKSHSTVNNHLATAGFQRQSSEEEATEEKQDDRRKKTTDVKSVSLRKMWFVELCEASSDQSRPNSKAESKKRSWNKKSRRIS